MRTILSALLLLLAGACGEPRAPGGAGRLDRRVGVPDRLVLSGAPYELGWWHGRLLREEILARVDAARAHVPRARGLARVLAQHVDLCVDQTLHRLSERLLQELEGMAAATGLEPAELIRPDVARDALRMKGIESLATGTAGLARIGAGYEGRLLLGGPGAARLARAVVVLHRKPTGRPASVMLAAPGSLGGWAAVTDDGRGFLLAEVTIRDHRRQGFGGGRPFIIAAREALEASGSAEGLMAEVTGTMGHIGLGVSSHPRAMPPVRAMAGVQVYGEPDPPWVLGDDAFLGIGPFEDPASPDARALQATLVDPPGLSPAERWLILEPRGAEARAPLVGITWQPGRATLRWRPGPADAAREVVLTP